MSSRVGHSRVFRWLTPLTIALVTLLSFVPAASGEFLSWDDQRNFVTNPYFRGLGMAQLKWMWSTFLLGHYIPVSWMSLGLDYTVWGMNPVGYHLTNMSIHAANAVLLYFIARRLMTVWAAKAEETAGELMLPAALAALLYSVHPLRVESVAWITERRDVLSGFFMLAATLAYLRAVQQKPIHRIAYWSSVVLFAAAVLSKATAITLPAVLLVLNVYPLRRLRLTKTDATGMKPIALELLPFGIPALFGVVVSVVAVHPPFLDRFHLTALAPQQLVDLASNVSAQNQFGLSGKLAVSAFSLCFYLAKTVLPIGLSPLYEMPRSLDPLSFRFLVSYAGVLGLVFIGVRGRRWPALATTIVIFVVTSAPMLGIVQNGPQIAADRYTYHAAPALSVLFAGALFVLLGPGRRYLLAGAGIVCLLMVLTWRQSRHWRTSETLWTRVLAVDSSSALGHSAMASLRYKQDRLDEAMAHSVRALTLAPDFAEARNDYAVGLTRQGRLDDALAEYRRALALKPAFDDAENNLGVLLMGLGHADSAVAHYRRALAINPSNPDAEVNWGNALVRSGRASEAIEHYQRAVWIEPTSADAHHNWGVALAVQSRYAEAVQQFQRALAIDPGRADSRDYLEKASKLGGSPPPLQR